MGMLWLALYLLFALAPLVFMLVGERPMGREFLRELSVAAGFVGIGLMALHFVLTARITAVKAPFGSDIVYYFHHRIAYVTLALWLVHPAILFLRFDWALQLLNVFTAPWRARWGVGSVVFILVLMAISIWRRQIKIEYVLWRMSHGVLAVLAMAAVMIHAYMVGRYTGTPVKQTLWLIYGGVCVLLVAYLRVYKPWRMLRRPYRVVEVRSERGATWSLALEPLGHFGLRFQPGQFAWLTAWRSPFAAHEHPFSFSSSSERQGHVEFAIKELGDFTATIGQLQPGQHVYIDGPYGSFSPDRYGDAASLVLIAGGVGIAPIMSILRTMADRSDGRPMTLLYGSRDWESIAFREELDELERELNLKVVHVLEQPPQGWEGEVGYVTQPMLARHLPEGLSYRVFLCGPTGMLNAVESALARLGVAERRVHMERFDLN
ncbi:MAG: ferric reductase-like transmembrane domain-containing protein [Anaerolineae bacterium]|nr:ferric reductase-like transmembrane domain-containing protein [Anaerolineae bacterium]